MAVDAVNVVDEVYPKRETLDFGFDPVVKLLLQVGPLAVLNIYSFATMDGFFLFLSLLLDFGFAIPLLFSAANAYAYTVNRHKLSRSGLKVDRVVAAKSGSFLAFDTQAGKVFANGNIKDISDIQTASWQGQGRNVWVDVMFKSGPGTLVRMPARNDFQAADVVARICALAGLTLA